MAVRAFASDAPESGSHLYGPLAEGGAGLGAEDGEERVCGNDGLKLTAFLGRDDALRVTLG
jgi:hypothetical protein